MLIDFCNDLFFFFWIPFPNSKFNRCSNSFPCLSLSIIPALGLKSLNLLMKDSLSISFRPQLGDFFYFGSFFICFLFDIVDWETKDFRFWSITKRFSFAELKLIWIFLTCFCWERSNDLSSFVSSANNSECKSCFYFWKPFNYFGIYLS